MPHLKFGSDNFMFWFGLRQREAVFPWQKLLKALSSGVPPFHLGNTSWNEEELRGFIDIKHQYVVQTALAESYRSVLLFCYIQNEMQGMSYQRDPGDVPEQGKGAEKIRNYKQDKKGSSLLECSQLVEWENYPLLWIFLTICLWIVA